MISTAIADAGSNFRYAHRRDPRTELAPRTTLSPNQCNWQPMKKYAIGFVIFPNVTQLDFTGPLQVLHRVPEATIHIAAKTDNPVPSDCGLSLVPNTTFQDCPDLDVLCVPGGFGVSQAITDNGTIEFVRSQARNAKFLTSVCTGAFILGIAGLLIGRRATTHWAYTDLLPLVGATHENSRIVRDGNVITGGGVTAGIDFGLQLAAELAGEDAAEAIQLAIEYAPAPPFSSGRPQSATQAAREQVIPFYNARIEQFKKELHAALAPPI